MPLFFVPRIHLRKTKYFRHAKLISTNDTMLPSWDKVVVAAKNRIMADPTCTPMAMLTTETARKSTISMCCRWRPGWKTQWKLIK